MKKYRAWRKRIYDRSLAAIRLLDLRYLPMVAHPYREGEVAYDIELPLRDRDGEYVFCAHPSNVEELEDAIRHWFAALTRPSRGAPGEEGETFERVRVAEHYAHRAFHEDLPLAQRAALIGAIFRCGWFDIRVDRLRSYFDRLMRNAVSRERRVVPVSPGGIPAVSLDEPDPSDPSRTREEGLAVTPPGGEESEEKIDHWRSALWQFMLTIPPSRPKLRKMASLVLECRDEDEAVLSYGRGGTPQLKRLKAEVRAWQEDSKKAAP
jgi:hypothetical protein